MMGRSSLLGFVAVLAGCPGTSSPDAGGSMMVGQDGGQTDAGSVLDAGTADAGADGGRVSNCFPQEVSLLTVNYGDTDRYFVEVTLDGTQVALQLDTGSSLNFLYQPANSPRYVPDFAEVIMGCETASVDARNIPKSGQFVDGLEVVGTLGMELLLHVPTLLDVSNLRILRYDQWPEDIAAAGYSVAFDNVQDHVLVPVVLDGNDVRLMFDTGGGHTLWVGQEGAPGDTVQQVVDVEGNVFDIYTGTGLLQIGQQEERLVPVARALEFPYFDLTVDALGGNLHGLLGVTSFHGDALLFGRELDEFFVVRQPSSLQ